jgi:hypothetical protein
MNRLAASAQHSNPLAGKGEGRMNKLNLDEMVDRFLTWPLPKSVCSDLCATIKNYVHPRTGTSLLTADEARQMLEHVLNTEPKRGTGEGIGE